MTSILVEHISIFFQQWKEIYVPWGNWCFKHVFLGTSASTLVKDNTIVECTLGFYV
jgi:hypothetical protein